MNRAASIFTGLRFRSLLGSLRREVFPVVARFFPRKENG
jgi:hypothetical protein